jgi:hypothetical protein
MLRGQSVLCIPLSEIARWMQVLGKEFSLIRIEKTPFLSKGKVGKRSVSEFWSERMDEVPFITHVFRHF